LRYSFNIQLNCYDNSLLPPKGEGPAYACVTVQPAGLAPQCSRKRGKEQFFLCAVIQVQERRVRIQDRREGMPLRKGLLNTACTGNASSVAHGLELNSGEQLKHFALVASALLRA